MRGPGVTPPPPYPFYGRSLRPKPRSLHVRSHRGTKVAFPDSQPMRVSEEPVCIGLFRQYPVCTSLHLSLPFMSYRLWTAIYCKDDVNGYCLLLFCSLHILCTFQSKPVNSLKRLRILYLYSGRCLRHFYSFRFCVNISRFQICALEGD